MEAKQAKCGKKHGKLRRENVKRLLRDVESLVAESYVKFIRTSIFLIRSNLGRGKLLAGCEFSCFLPPIIVGIVEFWQNV